MKSTMKEIIQNDTKENNRGFTLVELIVVLVILAILAAILVPALLGYIDRAKASQDLLNAKNLYTAAQTVASEYYAQGKTISSFEDADFNRDVKEIADLKNTDFTYGIIAFGKDTSDPHERYTVQMVTYVNNKDDMYYMRKGSAWEHCMTGGAEEVNIYHEIDTYYWTRVINDKIQFPGQNSIKTVRLSMVEENSKPYLS